MAQPCYLISSGIRIWVNQELPVPVVYRLLNDAYAVNEIELVRRYLTPGEKVVAIEGDFGMISAAAALRTGVVVNSYCPSPKLLSHFEKTAKANGVLLRISTAVPSEMGEAAQVWMNEEGFEYRMTEKEGYQAFDVEGIRTEDAVEGAAAILVTLCAGQETFFRADLPKTVRKVIVTADRVRLSGRPLMGVFADLCSQGFLPADQLGFTTVFNR